MPRKITPQEELFCHKVGFEGYPEILAIQEVFKNLRPKTQYNKCSDFRKRQELQDRINYWMKEAWKEPERIMRSSMRIAASLLADPHSTVENRQWSTIWATMAKLSGRMDKAEENPIIPDIKIKVEYYRPEAPKEKES